jgi:hypothetical protein
MNKCFEKDSARKATIEDREEEKEIEGERNKEIEREKVCWNVVIW